ncbi:hypothetical protein [Methylocella sp.]|uniref:hypothetical protein n=1 Tax=Methylocella sp. TaxID=1978226 RepID=UPI003C26CE5B
MATDRRARRHANFPAAAETFTAKESGRLFFVAHYPGAWLDETGGFAPDCPRNAGVGALAVAILVWKEPAADALALFAAKDKSGLAASARASSNQSGRRAAGPGSGAPARRKYSASPSLRRTLRPSSAAAAAMRASSNIRSTFRSTRRRACPGAGA